MRLEQVFVLDRDRPLALGIAFYPMGRTRSKLPFHVFSVLNMLIMRFPKN